MPFVIGPPRSPVIRELIRLQAEERKAAKKAEGVNQSAKKPKAKPEVAKNAKPPAKRAAKKGKR